MNDGCNVKFCDKVGFHSMVLHLLSDKYKQVISIYRGLEIKYIYI